MPKSLATPLMRRFAPSRSTATRAIETNVARWTFRRPSFVGPPIWAFSPRAPPKPRRLRRVPLVRRSAGLRVTGGMGTATTQMTQINEPHNERREEWHAADHRPGYVAGRLSDKHGGPRVPNDKNLPKPGIGAAV